MYGQQKLHFVFNNSFFENRAVYEIRWENIVERGRPQLTVCHMLIACWLQIHTHTHTHTICVILTAFPVQQWSHEHASILRRTYIAFLVIDLFLRNEEKIYDCVIGSVVCLFVCFLALQPILVVFSTAR
jgi:hypothetical protein